MIWKDFGFPRQQLHLLLLALLSFSLLAFNGCEGVTWNEERLSQSVRSQGELRVLVLEHPLVHDSSGPGAPRGLETNLLQHFARSYGLKLRFIPFTSREDLLEALRWGQGDLAAGRFRSPSFRDGYLAGPPLEDTRLSLFCHRSAKVQNIRDLPGKTLHLAAQDNATAIDARLKQLVPEVEISLLDKIQAHELIRLVAKRKDACALVENMEGALAARTRPQVEKIAAVSESYSISWILRPEQSDLNDLLKAWFQKASRQDEIMKIQDRYQSNLSELDRFDVRHFLQNLRTRYPRYARAFRQSAARHNLDWRLVAAVAYQESHWDEAARSYTGVKGLMQLTSDTAAHLGVEDRTDPFQSIEGGAAYLRELLNRFSPRLDPQDRLALALASYNCGPAQVRNAQILALEKGLNPNSWRHLRRVLPLLEDPEVASRLDAPTARGRETVRFVDRVLAYKSLWHLLH